MTFHRWIKLLLVISFLVFFGPHDGSAAVEDSVVKVFVASNQIDFYRPWQSLGIGNSVGSGFVISGKRILTNAHVAANDTFIQIKKNSSPKRYTAKLEAIGHDCDLALLTVADDEFWQGVTPLTFGDLPKLQDQVTVLGFPQGGDKLSITKGVVSRIELNTYSQSGRNLLAVQIDAAINPGNSGGPVLDNDKVVGVAMQVLQSGQNIGYIIPTPIINHFFDDLKDGVYNGFPILGIDYQSSENDALRQLFNVPEKEGGILITDVMPFSPGDGGLEEHDIILSIDNTPIAEDGTFQFRGDERLAMPHLITQKQDGESISLKIIHEGKIQNIDLKLSTYSPLVPYPNAFQKPSYFIRGGLVFSVLSSDLIQSWGPNWWEKAPLEFTYYFLGSGRFNKNRLKEVIVLLNVLPDDVNVGYHDFGNDIVTSVNSEQITSFKQFVELVSDDKPPYIVIETAQNSKIILNNQVLKEADAQIIERNNIPSPYSADVAGWLHKN